MKSAQERWAKAKREGRRFQKGDLVWLEGRNLKINQPMSKLTAKQYGPFLVAQALSPVTYQLTLPTQWKIHPVFHVDLLTPYKEMAFHGTNYTRPPPDLINNEEEYEVEQILDSRVRGQSRRVQYLVKWVRYPDSDNQWLDADQLTADDAIQEFKKRCPNAVVHIKHATTDNPLIDFPLMSSPTPSTIENILHSGASSPHEYSLAALLTTTDLQQVLERFPDPTQPPDSDDSLATAKPITSGLDLDEPVVVRTVTPAELRPYSVDLADYSPMREDDSEIRLSCAPGGPHCAELDQPRCVVCCSFCKEPGGPTNRCFCRQEAEGKPKYVPSGDEIVHNLGPVYPHPGGTTPGPCVSRIFQAEEGSEEDEEDSSAEEDYDHDKNPFPVPTLGSSVTTHTGVGQGRTMTHSEQSPRNGRASSPTPPGFVLNLHPNYIPFKLVDDKTGQQIPAKYVQLFLNNDDPYTYGKMSANGLTFIAKIQAAPNTDTWEKPEYKAEDTQYFDAKYHDRAEVDAAVSRLCDPSLQAEVRRYRATWYQHCMIGRKIDRLEGELYAMGMKKCASLRWLMAANAKARIKAKRDEEGFVRVALPWEHVHNMLHVDDLDDGL